MNVIIIIIYLFAYESMICELNSFCYLNIIADENVLI